MPEPIGWPDDPDSQHPLPANSLLIEDGLELLAPIEIDAGDLFVAVDENREYLREWLPWLDDVNSVDDEVAMIRRTREDKNSDWIYLIRSFGELVGVVSLNWVDWNNRSFGVGYWISESSSGRGIITKACSRIIEHCFNDLRLHRSVIEVAVENHSSRAVAERLGMRLEGISKDREWLYDHFTDSAMYAITAPEWKAQSGVN
tara:strand:- start:536 stop:1141 length:606 start_codon:yes stop_codon:yes gene_type:complete